MFLATCQLDSMRTRIKLLTPVEDKKTRVALSQVDKQIKSSRPSPGQKEAAGAGQLKGTRINFSSCVILYSDSNIVGD